MSNLHERAGSLVDPAVLAELQAELGDPSITGAFVQDYVAMLPNRVSRLHHAVDAQDLGDAMDAVLSLKTSSDMVGAVCLRRLATELEDCLKLLPDAEQLARLNPRLAEIEHYVPGTIRELKSPLQ